MKKWENRVIDNILLHSLSDVFCEALKEWFFSGKIHDRKTPSFSCELCDNHRVRYQFVITNKNTNKQLMVGSSCILKYDSINVYDSDNTLLKTEYRRKTALDTALENSKIEQVKLSLRSLWRVSGDRIKPTLADQAKRYFNDGHTTPKVCLMWFSMMNRADIDYDPQLFKVNLRKSAYLDQLLDFDRSQLDLISAALTGSQLKKVNELRNQFSQE